MKEFVNLLKTGIAMDISKMIDSFDISSKGYRILVVIAVILIAVIFWMKHRINQDNLIPLSNSVPNEKEMILHQESSF